MNLLHHNWVMKPNHTTSNRKPPALRIPKDGHWGKALPEGKGECAVFTAVSRGKEGRDCLPSCLLDVYPTPMQVSHQLYTSSTGPCAGNALGHSAPINRAIGIHAPSCQTTVRARQWMSLAMLAIEPDKFLPELSLYL